MTAIINHWLTYLEQQGKAESTVQCYDRDLQDFFRWYRGSYGEEKVDPTVVLPRDVEDYKAYLQTVRRAAPRTINRRLAALSRFFKWAAARDLVQRDPTTDLRTLRLPRRRPKALTAKEERRLRRAVELSEDLRDIAIMTVLLDTGIRVGELLALRRDDVVINARSGSLTVRRGKGGVGRRIPLKANVRNALQAYLDQVGEDVKEGGPLWVGIRGPLKSPSGINRMVSKYARAAEVEEVSPHALRHTFATRYLEANPDDLRGLASLLGHGSLNTVMIYTEPSEEDLLDRLERMGMRVDLGSW